MTMIRRATLEDVPALLEMGERFSEKAKLCESVGYDAESMRETFTQMISGGHPVFIGESGMIGAAQMPHPFNHSHIMAQEIFWWSEGREGMALFDALLSHCEAHCDSLAMITLEAIKPEATSRVYLRHGFKPLEHSFLKVF